MQQKAFSFWGLRSPDSLTRGSALDPAGDPNLSPTVCYPPKPRGTKILEKACTTTIPFPMDVIA